MPLPTPQDPIAPIDPVASQAEVVQRTIDPSKETTSGRLTSLLDQNSSYIQKARAGGVRTAARRGMQNSSIAAEAGESGAISSALPIATEDAAAYRSVADTNVAQGNETSRFNVGQTNALQRDSVQQAADVAAQQRGFTQQTAMQGRDFVQQDSTQAKDFAQQTSTQQAAGAIDLANIVAGGQVDLANINAQGLMDIGVIDAQGNVDSRLLDQRGQIDARLLDAQGNIDSRLLDQRGQIDAGLMNQKGQIDLNFLAQRGIVDAALKDQQGNIDARLLDAQGNIDSRILDQRGRIDRGLIDARGKVDMALLDAKGALNATAQAADILSNEYLANQSDVLQRDLLNGRITSDELIAKMSNATQVAITKMQNDFATAGNADRLSGAISLNALTSLAALYADPNLSGPAVEKASAIIIDRTNAILAANGSNLMGAFPLSVSTSTPAGTDVSGGVGSSAINPMSIESWKSTDSGTAGDTRWVNTPYGAQQQTYSVDYPGTAGSWN